MWDDELMMLREVKPTYIINFKNHIRLIIIVLCYSNKYVAFVITGISNLAVRPYNNPLVSGPIIKIDLYLLTQLK